MNEKLNVGIVWVNPYNINLGVAALAYSSLALIFDAARENKQQIEITILGSSKYGDDSLTINEIEYEFKNLVGLDYSLKIKSIAKIILRFNQHKIWKLSKFDIVFDMGEGDSFSDIYGQERFHKINSSKNLFNKIGVKQFLLPQTIGPFLDVKVKRKAIKAMKSMEYILARDYQSYDYATNNIPEKTVVESIDVAFYMPFIKTKYSEELIHVGLNVSGLLWMGGYTQDNQFNLSVNYQELVYKTIEYFLSQEKVRLHIVPHVVGNESYTDSDCYICDELHEKFPDTILAPKFSTPIEAKSYISGLDFFTGARMHACIAAFSSGVPVFPMAYSRKFNGLFEDTLKYSFMGDCVNDSTSNVLQQMTTAFSNREDLKKNIAIATREIISPRLKELKRLISKALMNA
nr:polysaccharide pyruvyl transferase family protein [uncultured Marinifilum sp.]